MIIMTFEYQNWKFDTITLNYKIAIWLCYSKWDKKKNSYHVFIWSSSVNFSDSDLLYNLAEIKWMNSEFRQRMNSDSFFITTLTEELMWTNKIRGVEKKLRIVMISRQIENITSHLFNEHTHIHIYMNKKNKCQCHDEQKKKDKSSQKWMFLDKIIIHIIIIVIIMSIGIHSTTTYTDNKWIRKK